MILVGLWTISDKPLPKPQYFKAKCWKCGDASFVMKGAGRVVCLHTDESIMSDSDDSDYKDGTLNTITTVRNVNKK